MSGLLLNWENKINSPELEAYLQQFGVKYYLSAEQINELRDAMNSLFVQAKAFALVSEFILVHKSTDNPNGNIELNDIARGFGNDGNYWTLARYKNYLTDNNVNNPANYEILASSGITS
jgi:hypothetical protein